MKSQFFTTRFTKDFHKERKELNISIFRFVNFVLSLCLLWWGVKNVDNEHEFSRKRFVKIRENSWAKI